MNPSSRRSGDSSSARSGGTIVTWLQMQEKFFTPSARARFSVSAVDGAVVSKPIAKNTTSRVGVLLGDPQRIERRVDHPHVRARRLGLEQAAVRSRHPHHVAEAGEDHRLVSCAIAMPSSTRPIGITQTGQPGPWTSSTFAGSRSSTPYL